MRTIALVLLLLAATVGTAAAQGLPALNGHVQANGQPDPGTTAPLPNGGTQTTYGDGWTRTTEPDNSFGAGGTKVVEKDNRGRIVHIIKYDPKKHERHHTMVEDRPDGSRLMTYANYDANGGLIDTSTEKLPATTTMGGPPPSGPPSDDPGYAGGGPPPSGPGPGGPGVAPLFGGFQFGIGGEGENDRRGHR